MTNKIENIKNNQRGGKMSNLINRILIATTIIAASFMGADTMNIEYIGRLPEIVITAERYEGEDIAYCGMLPEIVVTATRGPEIGMLPEVLITAPRYEVYDPGLALMRMLRRRLSLRTADLVLIVRVNSRSTGYLN